MPANEANLVQMVKWDRLANLVLLAKLVHLANKVLLAHQANQVFQEKLEALVKLAIQVHKVSSLKCEFYQILILRQTWSNWSTRSTWRSR